MKRLQIRWYIMKISKLMKIVLYFIQKVLYQSYGKSLKKESAVEGSTLRGIPTA